MIVRLTPQQRERLMKLVDEALRDLGPEIHRAAAAHKNALQEWRRDLQTLQEQLAAPADVAVSAGETSAPGDSPRPPLVPKVPRLIQGVIDRLVEKGKTAGLSPDEKSQLDEALDYLDELTIFGLQQLKTDGGRARRKEYRPAAGE